jgi:hypothetical protein
MYSVSHMFIKITWDEVGGRVGINRGRKAPYFTRHFAGFPAFIPWFSTCSMVSRIPSFITYRRKHSVWANSAVWPGTGTVLVISKAPSREQHSGIVHSIRTYGSWAAQHSYYVDNHVSLRKGQSSSVYGTVGRAPCWPPFNYHSTGALNNWPLLKFELGTWLSTQWSG